MATAPTISRPSHRFRTRTMPIYTPFTLNPSALPYGLWIDIPFRTRGSTAIRSEAKGRGARYCPAAKGNIKWWMPQNRLTQDTVDWLNKHQMIRGERKAPVFHPNVLKLTDINLGFPFRLYLSVPFADKDTAKNMGAKWSAEDKRWYYDATNINQSRFNDVLKREWAYSFHGVLANANSTTAIGVYFFTEDLGGATAVQSAAAPHVPQAWSFHKNGMFITMHTTADGNIALASDDESHVDGVYTKDEARGTWNALLADGWVVSAVSQKTGG